MRTEPSRTGSMVVTLYGDAVLPRGGSLWVGTVLDIFAALGIPGNVVRTAMSRLAADGWLERRRAGRHGFYLLSAKGRDIVAQAGSRIYAGAPAPWDGALRLAFGGDRAAMEAAGFAPAAPGVMVAATPATEPPGAVHLRATGDPAALRDLARQAWQTDRLGDGYARFAAAFAPLEDAAPGLPGLQALAARLLLVHQYRRLVLHDPLLPPALLPPDWPGTTGRALCARLYRALLPASERWLDAHARTEDGPLPPPDIPLDTRFAPASYEIS